eukprot:6196923-Pleurochrysis_carterae.AAC.3
MERTVSSTSLGSVSSRDCAGIEAAGIVSAACAASRARTGWATYLQRSAVLGRREIGGCT